LVASDVAAIWRSDTDGTWRLQRRSGYPAAAALPVLVELGHVGRVFLGRSRCSTFGAEGAGRNTT
jgi:hypothetical protein